ncbi:unnamed protein product [marine sediment metagenome]|uniref:Uncharacterized protein n=1 Tax=marine sediment metagenome TaxID=412755 RepID=X0Z433_9ZZZZ
MAETQNVLPVGDWLIGAILTTSVIIGTTPTALPATALANRRFLDIQNVSGVTIYIGNIDVTVANGYPVANGTSYPIDLDAGVIMYGIEAAGSREVRVLEAS